jgi:hypothetical protein
VVLGQEGHEGAEGVGRGRGVCEDLGQVGSSVGGRGDAARDGDGQRPRGRVVFCHGHLDVVFVVVVDGRGGGRRGGGGGGAYGEWLGAGLSRVHNASAQLLVDAAGAVSAGGVRAFAGTALELVRQLDGWWHQVRRTKWQGGDVDGRYRSNGVIEGAVRSACGGVRCGVSQW